MKASTAVISATIYLLVYMILFSTGLSISILSYLFLTSPLVLIWMVFTILKDDTSLYPELEAEEEWGYKDKKRGDLGMF
ncbi:hypothetical protein [Mucilaginibacter lacusdianchii]|uniref:hypothetical protein n=1 Tax=Mucilaginibacter lacusdianchii TaxID=2684211 RepID=UPI00131ADDB8|nr:hypothetical protein [Mucilaginibacter sp. JXJ CY 39]